MGQPMPKPKPIDFEDILSNTEFDMQEIYDTYHRLLRDHPDGYLTKANFRHLYCNRFAGNADEFADYVFRIYDTDQNGKIDFREFFCAVSVATRGAPKQKLKFAFSIFDLDGDGSITKEEMIKVITVGTDNKLL